MSGFRGGLGFADHGGFHRSLRAIPENFWNRARAVFLIGVALCSSAFALEPDEIALVINDRVPQSRQLAEFYARSRNIPPGRIIALEMEAPNEFQPPEEISAREYESKIAAPVRDFLKGSHLENQVKCLVSFWGLPLRVGRRINSPAENEELAAIDEDLKDVEARTKQAVSGLEELAKAVSPRFQPTSVPANRSELLGLAVRSESAFWSAAAAILAMPQGTARDGDGARLVALYRQLSGPIVATEKLAAPNLAPLLAHPITGAQLAEARQKQREVEKQAASVDLETAVGRQTLRRVAREGLGLLLTLKVCQTQYNFLQTAESEAAVDSELSLLWCEPYPRYRWQSNRLYWKNKAVKGPPALMVMRLDGPTAKIARDIITTSIEVEKTGLHGQVAIDARGKAPGDGYGDYDQTLRNLAAIVRQKTNLKVTLDNAEPLFPAHALSDVALYCGWYSLRQYVPCCRFNPGAVGFHVASFELISLHTPGETGWVRGLLSDGVVASIGPVSEPYVQSFPAADEFFPLLLTGKLTLAEVYWRTTPMTSWMQDCIGDPLYRPYAAHPALRPEDLPAALQNALEPAAHIVQAVNRSSR